MAQAKKQFNSDAKALEYIGYLTQEANVDTSKWDIVKFFSKNPKSLIRNPEEINKRFFELIGEIKQQRVAEPKTIKISDAAIKKAAKHISPEALATKEREIERLQRKIEQQEETIRLLHQTKFGFQQKLENAKKAWEKLKEAPVPDLKKAIQRLTDEGLYTDFKIRNSFLWCITSDVVMIVPATRERPGRFPLGKFAVKVNLKDFAVDVYPHENNVFYYGECHPYHDYGTKLCFQGAGIAAAKAERDLYKFLSVFAVLLRKGDGGIHFHPQDAEPNQKLQKNYYPKGK